MKPRWVAVLLTVFPIFAPAMEWTVANLAGTGQPAAADAPSGTKAITDPYGLVRGPDGAIWFCEHNGHRISRLAPDGTLSVIAGTGTKGYSGDGGPALAATLNLPHELRFGPDGALYVADTGNNVVRRIDLTTGVITTFAGTGQRGYSGDGGPAAQATFQGPHSIQFDTAGQLYVCDVGNHAIRRIDPKTGVITTIAGTGQSGFTGNGGPACNATLSGPKGIALDAAGNAWLVDTESHSIRRINAATGNLELMLGTGVSGDGPVGKATDCALNRPHGVFVDTDGSVLIGDSEAHRIRVLRPE